MRDIRALGSPMVTDGEQVHQEPEGSRAAVTGAVSGIVRALTAWMTR